MQVIGATPCQNCIWDVKFLTDRKCPNFDIIPIFLGNWRANIWDMIFPWNTIIDSSIEGGGSVIPCSQLVSHPHTSPTCSFGVWGGWGGGGWLTSCEQGVKEGSHTLYYFWIRTTHTIVNTIVNKTETGWNQLKLECKTRLSSKQPTACTIVIKTVVFW